MKFENLTPEQQEKAKACKTPEEVIALAKEEGYNLSDEELEAVSGEREWYEPSCPSHSDCYNDFHPAV